MGAAEVHAQARATEPLDRLAIQALGLVTLAEQRAAACLDPKAPVGTARAGCPRDPLDGSARALTLAGTDRRLDQIGQRPQRRTLLVVALGLAGRGQGRVVTAEPVVERRAQTLGDRQGEPFATRLGLFERGPDQLRELGL